MKRVTFTLIAITMAAAAFAQTAPTARILTIDDAVALALRESPMVHGSAAEVEAAIARLKAARAEKRPWLSGNGFVSTGDTPAVMSSPAPIQPSMIMDLPGERFTALNLSLMYPLFTSGRLEAMIRQAGALRGASEADLAAQKQEVALLTRTAYNDVLARRAMIQVASSRLASNNERLKNDRARLEQQQIPEYYVRRDEAEVASAQQDLTNAQRDADIALVGLRTVMGVSPDERIDVTGSLPAPDTAGLLGSLTGASAGQDPLPALQRMAERQRPELQATQRRVEGARAESRSVKASYLPQVSLGVMGNWMKTGGMSAESGTVAAVIASVPLYNGGQREARIREADAMREKQEQDRRQLALEVAQQVQTALLNLNAAEQNVGTAKAGLTAATAEYDAAQLRYQVGRSVVVEALDALSSRVRAEAGVVQALYEYNVARDRLLRAVGGLMTGTPQ